VIVLIREGEGSGVNARDGVNRRNRVLGQLTHQQELTKLMRLRGADHQSAICLNRPGPGTDCESFERERAAATS